MRITLLRATTLLMIGMTSTAAELPNSPSANDSSSSVVQAIERPDASRLHVVLIGGINKDPEEIRSKDRTVLRLARHFSQRVGVRPQHLDVLAAPDSFVSSATATSTAESIRSTVAGLKSLSVEDRLVVYYVGQANIVGEELRLNLPGEDLTHTEFTKLLAPLKPGLMIVVLDCPGAGLAAESLAEEDRILVFGARSDQPVSTRFSDYFVPALDDPKSDINDDGTITLLEAFQRTVQQIDALFRDQDLMKSESALLEDNGDATPSQQPWTYAESGNDGAVAATIAVDTWDVWYNSNQAVQPSQPSTVEEGVTP